MLVGTQAIEVAKKQQKELKKTKKELKKEMELQAQLQMQLEDEESNFDQIQQKFTSLHEELDFKSNKLQKLWNKYQ